jgi:uncharacterized membrane protein
MKAIVFAILAGLCWGIGEVFTKMVLHSKQIGPLTASAVRSTLAIPLMWIVFAIAVYGVKMKSEPADWIKADASIMLKLVLGSGVMAGLGGVTFFYLALSSGEVSRVKPIAFALAPVVGALLGWLMLGESMTPRKAVAIAIIVLGVVMLSAK